jgi:hypothetical protein
MTAQLAYQIIQQCSKEEHDKLMRMLGKTKTKPKRFSVDYWKEKIIETGAIIIE